MTLWGAAQGAGVCGQREGAYDAGGGRGKRGTAHLNYLVPKWNRSHVTRRKSPREEHALSQGKDPLPVSAPLVEDLSAEKPGGVVVKARAYIEGHVFIRLRS